MNNDILKTFIKYNPSHATIIMELQEILNKHEELGSDRDKIYEALEVIINTKIKVISDKEHAANLASINNSSDTAICTVKEDYHKKLEKLIESKSDIVYEVQMITGSNISEDEGKVEAVETALKKGTYNQASNVICKVIKYDVLCNKIDDYKFMFNL